MPEYKPLPTAYQDTVVTVHPMIGLPNFPQKHVWDGEGHAPFAEISPHFDRFGYALKDGRPCLQLNIKVDSPSITDGAVDVCLEFIKIKDRTHVRLNGVPLTEMMDAFNSKQLVDKIKQLIEKDKCIANSLANSILSIDLSETQLEQVEGQPRRCSFDVAGTWRVRLAQQKAVVLVEIVLDPFPLVMNVPGSWEAVWSEIFTATGRSIDKIVKNLLENVDKFSEILAILATEYAAEQWMKAALRAWLCRHEKAPVPQPLPEPVPVLTAPPVPAAPPPPSSCRSRKRKTKTARRSHLRTDSRSSLKDCAPTRRSLLLPSRRFYTCWVMATPVSTNIRTFHSFPCPRDKPGLIKEVKLLKEVFKKIIERDWNTTMWEDDYKLLTEPFGSVWDPDLWSAPVPRPVLRPEREDLANQGKDPRAEVEYIHNIFDCTGGLTALIHEADEIRNNQKSFGDKFLDFLSHFGPGPRPIHRGGGGGKVRPRIGR
ncbi:hypothetical protein B0H13DRAFT_1884341 [Mycena leptocephala]|nr:hypothetical protein B0H13DRAFT_1884341 [Mycena leptocephala]